MATTPEEKEKEEKLPRTIHTWANRIEQRIIEAHGEKEFAKLLLFFDQLIPTEEVSSLDRLAHVMKIMVVSNDAKAMQLAVIWMDRAGYGETMADGLFKEIFELRALQRKQGEGEDQATATS